MTDPIWPRVTTATIIAVALTACGSTVPDAAEPAPERPPPTATDASPEVDASPEPEPEPARRSPPQEIVPFEDGEELADVLAAAEEALAAADTPDDDRTRWAWAQQRAYRDLAANPGWVDDARAQVPEELRPAFDLALRASTELHELTTPRPELPTDWRIVAPPPLDELRGYYAEAEAATGVPWSVLAAIHHIETRFGRIEGDSHAGAQGPMQFMPPTWDAYGDGDVRDPRDAILGAGRYLAASGAPDDLRSAVFAYNRSDRYVEAVLAYAEAIDRYEHHLDAYHRWRVYYRTVDGDVALDEGYGT
jgi:membrane-bound lytic murein transglycosylase B